MKISEEEREVRKYADIAYKEQCEGEGNSSYFKALIDLYLRTMRKNKHLLLPLFKKIYADEKERKKKGA